MSRHNDDTAIYRSQPRTTQPQQPPNKPQKDQPMTTQSGQNYDYISLKKLTDEQILELERQAELLDKEENQ